MPGAEAIPVDPTRRLAEAVRAGLTRPGQKALPPDLLYDAIGSALFDAICLLPEYGLTRAGTRLLRRHGDEMAARFPAGPRVIELGSGSGRKTRILLESLAARGAVGYAPIDVSEAALAACARQIGEVPGLTIDPIAADYEPGLVRAVAGRRPGQSALVLFLGSTIGNLPREEAPTFLRSIRERLAPGDGLLLAADLQHDPERLILAYDDPAGVTAAFDRNLLARIDRELGADFDLRSYDHEARWNAAERRVEMHLVARSRQVVRIPGADCVVELEAGESIWTESSAKYHADEVAALGRTAGFDLAAQWIDEEWPFAQTLFAVPGRAP